MNGRSIVARRLMLRLAVAGMVFALAATAVLLAVDYRRELQQVQARLVSIEESYLGSIIEHTWLEDSGRLGILVAGIQRLPAIAMVEVRDSAGKVMAISGTAAPDMTREVRVFPLVREYNGRPLTIGEMEVIADLDSVRDRTLGRAWSLTAASVTLILLLSSLMYLMVHHEITGRLAAIAQHARRLGEHGLGSVPPITETQRHAPDELTELMDTFNEMSSALEMSYAAIRDREARYRELFTSFPVALFEEDFSAVRAEIDALRDAVADPAVHFADHPELVRGLTSRVRILGLNEAALALHRATRAEELLSRLSAIFTPASLDAFRRQLLAIWHGEADIMMESEVRTLDGDVRQVMVRWFVPPSARDDLSRVIVTTEDITERKLAERSLEITLEKLTEANGELERFAFVASHDLQEPVRSIVSFSQLLERRLVALESPDPEAKEFLHYLMAAGLRMQQQVVGLLDYSRAEHTNRPFVPVPLDAAAADAIEGLADAIRDAGARVTVAPLPTVMGDRPQLTDVLRQLIDNAIKFRRPDVAPEIAVSAARSGDQCRITVRDNGIGLDPVHAADVFQVFRRLHGPGRYPGAGIGLATCRRIVERHGGHIWVDAAPGPGAVFHFTLPAA